MSRLATLLCCATATVAALAHQGPSALDARHVISGRVLDPHRIRPEGAVLLLRWHDGESISARSVAIDKDGAFVTPPLTSGTYVLEVARTLAAASGPGGGIIGHAIVRLGETPLSGVSIEVRRDTAIAGHFVMETGKPDAKWPTSIVVSAYLALDGMPMWHGVLADGAPGGRFVLRNAFGPRVIRCGYTLAQGDRWWPSTVTLDGVDITNVPTDFSKHEGGRLEVGFTQTPARITGTVTDAEGLPIPAPWIIVNATGPALQQPWATTSDVAQGNAQGRFALAVIPGTYRVYAVPQDAFDSTKAARKAGLQFATDGVPISLREHEAKTVSLTAQPSYRQREQLR